MKKQKIVITLLTIVTLLLILMPNANAALQSSGNAGTKQTVNNWIVNIRKMEALNGGMGLTETIDSTLVPTTASNNVDVHMQRNSEYGAMAILSASSYGNPNVITNGGTTTGNKTGLVMRIEGEWAGEWVAMNVSTTGSVYQNILNANLKYKDFIENSVDYATKIGDAILETKGWHGSTEDAFQTSGVTMRSFKGSIFSYARISNRWEPTSTTGNNHVYYYEKKLFSRAAMVCGEGI